MDQKKAEAHRQNACATPDERPQAGVPVPRFEPRRYERLGQRLESKSAPLECKGCGTQKRRRRTGRMPVLRSFGFGVGQEFFVGAFEIFDVGVFEVPDAGGYFFDYVLIVSYQ